MTDRAEREPRTGWEREQLDDPADYADSHIELDQRGYFVTDNDVRYAYCRRCGHVKCECPYPEHEEPPERHRSYKPAARPIRDDFT